MSENYRKEDIRIIKTRTALSVSMYTLLQRRKFARITVNDLCDEALTSRATFYIHFCDKYSLLSYCLDDIRDNLTNKIHHFTYAHIEKVINQFICDNSKVITNLVENADSEVLNLLRNFMFSMINNLFKREESIPSTPSNSILYTFCSGGMVNLLLWQIENRFPAETPFMNNYLYDMLTYIMDWDKIMSKSKLLRMD